MIRAEYLYTDRLCVWDTIARGVVRCEDEPGEGDLVTRLGSAEVIVGVRRGDLPEVVIRRNPYADEPGALAKEALALLAYVALCESGDGNPGTEWRVGGDVVKIGLRTLTRFSPLLYRSGVWRRKCHTTSCLFRGACDGKISLFSDERPPHPDAYISRIYHQLVVRGADPLLEVGRVLLQDWRVFSPEALARRCEAYGVRLWLWNAYRRRGVMGPSMRSGGMRRFGWQNPMRMYKRNPGIQRLRSALRDVPPHLMEALLANTVDLLSMCRPEFTVEGVGGDVEVVFKGYAREHRGYIVPTERTLTALFGEEDGRRLHSALEEALDGIIEGVWR